MAEKIWEVNEDYECPKCGAPCEQEYELSGEIDWDGDPVMYSTRRERCTKCNWSFEH